MARSLFVLKSAFPKIILASGSYYITTVWPAIERYSIVVCQPIKRTNQIFCGYPDDNETYIITIQLGYVGDITSHWVKEFVIPVYTKVLCPENLTFPKAKREQQCPRLVVVIFCLFISI